MISQMDKVFSELVKQIHPYSSTVTVSLNDHAQLINYLDPTHKIIYQVQQPQHWQIRQPFYQCGQGIPQQQTWATHWTKSSLLTHQHFPSYCCLYILVFVVASNTSHLLFTISLARAAIFSINAHHTRLVKLLSFNFVCPKIILRKYFLTKILLEANYGTYVHCVHNMLLWTGMQGEYILTVTIIFVRASERNSHPV